VLNSASAHQDRMSRWILELQPRRGYYRTLVAIAIEPAPEAPPQPAPGRSPLWRLV
jgi:hypothetical protein